MHFVERREAGSAALFCFYLFHHPGQPNAIRGEDTMLRKKTPEAFLMFISVIKGHSDPESCIILDLGLLLLLCLPIFYLLFLCAVDCGEPVLEGWPASS